MGAAQGKSRFGWLLNPNSNQVLRHIIVQEQPIVLRAGNLPSTIQIEHRVEPTQVSASIYTWVPFLLNGVSQELSVTNTLLVLALPGVYRLGSQPTTGVVSFEEDGRTVEWDTATCATSAGGSGTVGPQGPQGVPGPAGTIGPQGPQGVPGEPASDTYHKVYSVTNTQTSLSIWPRVPQPDNHYIEVNGVIYHDNEVIFSVSGNTLSWAWVNPLFSLEATDEIFVHAHVTQ